MNELLDVIRSKQERLQELERESAQIRAELREATEYLTGRAAKAVRATNGSRPKSRHGFTNGKRRRPIQANSSVDWARRILDEAKRPLHIDTLIDIIAQEGGPMIKKATLVSNLSRYTKHRDTFSHTGPSTYGLLEWKEEDEPEVEHPEY